MKENKPEKIEIIAGHGGFNFPDGENKTECEVCKMRESKAGYWSPYKPEQFIKKICTCDGAWLDYNAHYVSCPVFTLNTHFISKDILRGKIEKDYRPLVKKIEGDFDDMMDNHIAQGFSLGYNQALIDVLALLESE